MVLSAFVGLLLFDDWLETRDLLSVRAAGTAGSEVCTLAITAYSGLLQERQQLILQMRAARSGPILVSSDDEEDDTAANVIVVSDDYDIWEQAFGRSADSD